MCGRFALTASPEELTRVFGLAECPDLAPRTNIAPATAIAVVRRSPGGDPVLHLLRWGLVPHWSQDPNRGARPINARSETVLATPAFREAFQKAMSALSVGPPLRAPRRPARETARA